MRFTITRANSGLPGFAIASASSSLPLLFDNVQKRIFRWKLILAFGQFRPKLLNISFPVALQKPIELIARVREHRLDFFFGEAGPGFAKQVPPENVLVA